MPQRTPTEPDARRRIPRTDTLLAAPQFVAAAEQSGIDAVKSAIRRAQGAARAGRIAPEAVAAEALADLTTRHARPTTLRRVVNATGVVLHTNLGRATLSPGAREAMTLAGGYCDVEFDLADGRRARRGRGTLQALAERLPERTGALVVNNGAAALALVAATLAVSAGRPEIVVSRGELVEIGDGFRIPELLESVGARLVDVGTTNRTHLRDYEAGIGPATGVVLKVHPSNFRVSGFTSSVPIARLAPLCAERALPLVSDIGSGLLAPDPLLPHEPDATTTLADGAAIVTASCDKLLGGPQGGLVLGDPDTVERVRRHPLARAMRVDKTTLAALEASLRSPTPTHQALHADADALRERAERLAAAVGSDPACAGLAVQVVRSDGAVGGGCAPEVPLPGWAVRVPDRLAGPLRTGRGHADDEVPAVVGRLGDGALLLDVRCVTDSEIPLVARAVAAACRAES